MGIRRRLRWCERLAHRREQQAILGEPDVDREPEALGPSGEQTGVAVGDELQRGRTVPKRPRQRTAERAVGGPVDQHPGGPVVHQRRPARIDLGVEVGRRVETEMLRDECSQLDPEQPASTLSGRSGAIGHAREATECTESAVELDEVAGHVGDEVDPARTVEEPDLAPGADLGDHEVGDGVTGRHVQTRRFWAADTLRDRR